MSQVALKSPEWQPVCRRADLVPDSGVCALVTALPGQTGDQQSVALFYLPGATPQLYAIDNWDPLAGAGVLARGLLAEVDGELTVCSPLYKHHYRLSDGVCLEDDSVQLNTWAVMLDGDTVMLPSGRGSA